MPQMAPLSWLVVPFMFWFTLFFIGVGFWWASSCNELVLSKGSFQGVKSPLWKW